MGIKFDGHGITFDSAGSRSFGNDFVRNVVIFGVGNTSSSQADNRKNNFLILGEVPTYGINVSFGSPEKKFNINFTKTNTKFCSVYIIILVIVICLLMEKKSLNSKLTTKMLTFQLNLSQNYF